MRSSGISDGMQVGWFSLQLCVRKMIRSCRMQWGATMHQISYHCGSSQQAKQKFVVIHRGKKMTKLVFDRTTLMFRPGRYQIKREISNTDRQIRFLAQLLCSDALLLHSQNKHFFTLILPLHQWAYTSQQHTCHT